MKALKMLGFGVLAALLIMAFGGAPAAMAEGTELCSADQTPCGSENAIMNVHEVTPEGKKAVLLSSLGNVECDVLFQGEVLSETTNGPAFISGKFTYTNCLLKGSACEVKETGTGSSFTILKEGHETASVTAKSEATLKCGGLINCTFGGESIKGIYTGQLLSTLKNGELSINGAAVKVTGTLCPKEGKIDLTLTPLVETFLSQGNRYCLRYINSRGRWLLGPSSTACSENQGIQGYNYEMAYSLPAGLVKGDMLCVWDEGLTFYLTRSSGTVCGNIDKTPLGKYELAEVA